MTCSMRASVASLALATLAVPATWGSELSCSDHSISASAVRTPSDVEAFVQCAAEYLAEHGPAEARRAFHDDERWRHGSIYVFVDGIAESGQNALVHVYPPDPSREGGVWGAFVDSFGTDYYAELHRMMTVVEAGWIYYAIGNPETGLFGSELKASYVIEVNWNGQRAAIGAGIYQPDLPGTCTSEDVNAASLVASPGEAKLQEFVRCAALLVESNGYSAKDEFESSTRWRHGGTHVFVMDTDGKQIVSGNPFRVNGTALHEFGSGSPYPDQFGGRDIPAVGDAFGEAFVYYRTYDAARGGMKPRIGFLKRVVTNGVTLLVGSSYDPSGGLATTGPTCSDNRVAAAGIRTREDIQAFVRCAAEYVSEHGTEEARRAFHEDERWKLGPYYVFVDLIAQPDDAPLSHIAVFPPNPDWEGTSQVLVDNFGTDYFDELHRIMTFGDAGWIHYAFTNFVTGRSEPKSSYVDEVDWQGHRAVVGVGIYERDLPGNCDSNEVSAAGLEQDPNDDRLREFVRCAALELQSQGLFAAPRLSRDPRWRRGSVYVFGLDTHGNELFSGAGGEGLPGAGVSELNPFASGAFGGRDVVSAADAFGESFSYYSAVNPSTGMLGPKVSFVKRIVVQGIPVLVAAGYYPDATIAPPSPGGGPSGPGGQPGAGTSRGGQGGTVTLRLWQAPTMLNPYLSRGTKDIEATSLVLEPLAEYNERGELVPVLATAVPTVENEGISADRRTVRWTLRDGVAWSDGTPLTADDVVFTWQYCTAPGSDCVRGSRFETVESIEAMDEQTVVITFDGPVSNPYGPFVANVSPILQRNQFSNCMGERASACTDQNFAPIGTGPFSVAEFSTNGTIRYRFNPHYRGIESGLPYFTEVLLQGGGDAESAARAVLQSNEADYAWNLQIEPSVLASLAAGRRGRVVSSFSTLVERLMLNQTNPDPSLGDLRSEYADGTNPHPFLTDPVVGRALSLAIDRNTLVKTGYGRIAGRPTCNIWPAPPAQVSPSNDECLVQNIGLANQILDEAGIVDSDGDGVREREGVPLRILFQTSTNAVRQDSQRLIKEWWAEIGVETELRDIDASVFFGSDANSPDTIGRFYADVEMYADGATGVDAESYLGAWVSAQIAGAANSFQGLNVQRFHSDEYDRLHGELQNSLDPDDRNRLTIELNDLLVQSYSVVPLIHRGTVSAHGNDIEGVRENSWDADLWNVEEWRRKE